jgi:stage II sporulation protein GA (sporulation sigma-E factor processing peptidase)
MDGFYDTGNLLVDPFCGKPVSVMSAEVLDTLLCRETSEKLKYIMENPGELENTELSHLKPHFLPVRTVSQKDEMMLAITLDELCIHTPREVVRVSGPVFALLYESSALGNAYKVLLNSRLLQ